MGIIEMPRKDSDPVQTTPEGRAKKRSFTDDEKRNHVKIFDALRTREARGRYVKEQNIAHKLLNDWRRKFFGSAPPTASLARSPGRPPRLAAAPPASAPVARQVTAYLESLEDRIAVLEKFFAQMTKIISR